MIIVDTDIFSSLLKVGRLNLLLKALDVNSIVIPSSVYEELKSTYFFDKVIPLLAFSEKKLSKSRYVLVKKVNLEKDVKLFDQEKLKILGKGEIGCFILARKFNGRLFMDDKTAGKVAKEEEIEIITLPTFLIDCKRKNILSKKELDTILKDLKEKDYYEFSEVVRRMVLDC